MITALRRRRARDLLDVGRPAVGIDPPEQRPAVLYGSELLVAAPAVALGLLAWAGLALAHIGRYSLLGSFAVAVFGCGVILAIAWRARGRPRLGVDPAGLAMVAGLALVAGLLFFPGFPYGVGDKDPGLYVVHGIAIARTGSYALTDPALDAARVPSVAEYTPDARFPGVWINDRAAQRIVPQFYHLWPALLASGFRLGGYTGLANLAPFAALLGVLTLALVVRRAFGLVAGSLAGLLLATNMLEVWQAKYQTTEVFTELLIGAALLGVVIAIRTGWRPAAGVGGLLLGLSYLARPDGLLLVLLAVGVGCVLLVLGRFDARAGWFAAGVAVTLPHGLLQAYWLARTYTLANYLPRLSELAFLVAVPVVLAVLVRMLLPRLGTRLTVLMEDPRVQRWCGVAITAAVGLVIAIGLLRPSLFGASYGTYNGRLVRTYAEQTMIRLSWFFTLPGLALMWAGVGVLALRRWRAAAWAAVLPALVLLPLYTLDPRNSSRMMWWGRRFVPVVLPGVVMLMAIALTVGLLWTGRLRWPARLAAGAAAAFLLAVFLAQSLPLRGHHEMAGSFEITQRVARAAGDRQGVFLWEQTGYLGAPMLFGAPVWLQVGQISAMLPKPPAQGAYVRWFVRGFPSQPVFVITPGGARPSGYDGLEFAQVDHVVDQLPIWKESNVERPSYPRPRRLKVDFSVWRVVGT
jgi:hypothetical protein